MFLLHSALMRSILAWAIHRILPEMEAGWFRTIVWTATFCVWLGLLVYLSVLWKDRVDGISIVWAKWAEEAVLDPEVLSGLFFRTTRLVNGFTTRQSNGHATGQEMASKEMYAAEMESKV